MIKLLCKLFVPENGDRENLSVRTAYGVFSGSVGIAVNILLFAVKISVGIISGSIAIAADAVNNHSGRSVVGFATALVEERFY